MSKRREKAKKQGSLWQRVSQLGPPALEHIKRTADEIYAKTHSPASRVGRLSKAALGHAMDTIRPDDEPFVVSVLALGDRWAADTLVLGLQDYVETLQADHAHMQEALAMKPPSDAEWMAQLQQADLSHMIQESGEALDSLIARLERLGETLYRLADSHDRGPPASSEAQAARMQRLAAVMDATFRLTGPIAGPLGEHLAKRVRADAPAVEPVPTANGLRQRAAHFAAWSERLAASRRSLHEFRQRLRKPGARRGALPDLGLFLLHSWARYRGIGDRELAARIAAFGGSFTDPDASADASETLRARTERWTAAWEARLKSHWQTMRKRFE